MRGLCNLRALGYTEEHIQQVQGLVDACLGEYDNMLRLMVHRLATTTAAHARISMSAAVGGKGRKLIEDNDRMIGLCLEFLARRTYDRVPFKFKSKRKRDKQEVRGWIGPPVSAAPPKPPKPKPEPTLGYGISWWISPLDHSQAWINRGEE